MIAVVCGDSKTNEHKRFAMRDRLKPKDTYSSELLYIRLTQFLTCTVKVCYVIAKCSADVSNSSRTQCLLSPTPEFPPPQHIHPNLSIAKRMT